MANYQYDEGGSMATYFALTFLCLILVPYTLTLLLSSKKTTEAEGCTCSQCRSQRECIWKRNRRSIFSPKLGFKTVFLIGGWAAVAFLIYNVSGTHTENTVYDPFEILGIRSGTSEKEIKSHYKKLSRKFHPDKVKLVANQTMEMVEAYFVELTKAYKSLTDETVRKNLEMYGHPDGRQEVSMGIAIPKWVVEGQHRFIVLVGYCLVLGGLLPVIVGRWWFGNRIKTKDGVNAKSASLFFKNIKEESTMVDLLGCLGRAFEIECPKVLTSLGTVEEEVCSRLGKTYRGSPAQTLLYAHLLRVELPNDSTKKAQDNILSKSPMLLTSLLNIAMARNWLTPTLNAMRLHAYVTQAILPTATSDESAMFTQLPQITEEEASVVVSKLDESDLTSFIKELQDNHDAKAEEVTKAGESCGRIELEETSFRVIGERIITPSSIIQLVVKARVVPAAGAPEVKQEQKDEKDIDAIKRLVRDNEEKDMAFLTSRRESEELTNGLTIMKRAHTPFWPAARKPSWWVLLADAKLGRIAMPPMKISDVPFSDPSKERNYRTYKFQFQGPPQVQLFTWKMYIVSDTFIGQELQRDIILKVDDVSMLSAEEKGIDDVISDPEEDSIAGQMAMMRGSGVKKSPAYDDSDEDDSNSDSNSNSSSTSSDSDSDSD